MAKHLTKLGLGRDEIPPQEPHPAADQTRRRRKQAILLVVLALLVAYLFALGRSYLAIQDGMMDVNQSYDALTAAGIPAVLAPPNLRMQSAWGVARAALEQARANKLVSGAELTANYLRLSQAERERLAKEKQSEH